MLREIVLAKLCKRAERSNRSYVAVYASEFTGRGMIIDVANIISDICGRVKCVKISNVSFVFHRESLLEYCGSNRVDTDITSDDEDAAKPVTISIKLPKNELERIEQLAEEYGTTRSAIIRMAIEELLKKVKEAQTKS